ncbi:MAG: hypothetical protein JXQ73_11270 [Phycisphaerae bacterium]|nr:hypothetical protein [Phycisphaerae bacterium]
MIHSVIGWFAAVLAASSGTGSASSSSAFASKVWEAEQCVTAEKASKVEGASGGKAVLLAEPGASLDIEVALGEGAYSLQIRARAKDPDTFNELRVQAGEQTLRALYPTNSVFTRAKGHFQRGAEGAVRLTITLIEGSGVYVDQVRVFRQGLDYRFKQLKPQHLTTTLARQGEALCQIVLPDDGSCRDVAERLAGEIGKRGGKRPEIRPADKVGPEDFERWHLIMLGDLYSNIAILRTSPRSWGFIPRPEPGEFNLMTIHNPHGRGKNVIVVGGRDAKTIGMAADELVRRLPDGPEVTIPRIWLPAWPQPMPREELKQLMVDSGKWIRQGAIRTLQTQWKRRGLEGFRLLGYRYIEYKDSADTITQRRDDGFSDAEFFKVISAWDRWEEDPYFSDAERLELTEAMWRLFEMCIDPFGRYVGGGQHLKLDQIAERVRAQTPEIRHNHQTFPAMSFAYAADYFGKYYGLGEAKVLAELADRVYEGQAPCAKPQCDSCGYQSITMIHMIRHAVARGDWEYVRGPQARQFLRLEFMSRDNQGMPVGYGDSGGYIGQAVSPWLADVSSSWSGATGGRFDPNEIGAEKLLGVYVHPLEPRWHAKFKGEPPVEACFDKVSFRGACDPNRAYLLLDGLSGGYHGHWDGNSILRLTDNGRVWLCEGDYLNGDLKDHNTVTIVKDGQSGRGPICTRLVNRADLHGLGATRTRWEDYCQTTWDRHVLWHKTDDVFMVVDDLTAKADGTYDFKCRWRTLGEVKQEAGSLEVAQKDGQRFFIRSAGPCRMRLSDDERDGRKNWSKYPYAEPVTRLVVEQDVRQMKKGQRRTFVNVMYAVGPGQEKEYEALVLSPGVVVLKGSEPAIAGVGGLRVGDRSVEAGQFWVSDEGIYLAGLKAIRSGDIALTANPPVDFSWPLEDDVATVTASRGSKVTLATLVGTTIEVDGKSLTSQGVDEPLVLDLSAGEHRVVLLWASAGAKDYVRLTIPLAIEAARLLRKSAVGEKEADSNMEGVWKASMPAAVTALAAGDMDGDGVEEVVVGCEDGALQVLDGSGSVMWSHKFGAKVNDVCVADVDLDGAKEVVAGVEDEHVYVVKAGGTRLWSRRFEPYNETKAHVRVVHVADFDRDGSPEVAVGCSNSCFHVLDNKGRPRVGKDGARWELETYHEASAIGSGDLDGDGQVELLAGCTYFARYIRNFQRRGGNGLHTLKGCISGCGSIATADVDGDGKPEAVFADKDGRVAAAEQNGPYKAKVLWEQFVGDDEITKLVSRDLDGDGGGDLAVASRSGFVARLASSDGRVQWVRYGKADMTDVAAGDMNGDDRPDLISVNLDGTVRVHDASGQLLAQQGLGKPLTKVVVVKCGQGRRTAFVAAGGELRGVRVR